MYFPKEQSNPISNMVAELNAQLGGGTYFTVSFDGKLYTLNPTNLTVAQKKFKYVSIDGGLTYSDMFQYLSGILVGLRLAQEAKK